MLSYMLPTEDKPPPDNRNGSVTRQISGSGGVVGGGGYEINDIKNSVGSQKMTLNARAINVLQSTLALKEKETNYIDEADELDKISKRDDEYGVNNIVNINGRKESNERFIDSPNKHFENIIQGNTARKTTSALYTGGTAGRTVVKDDSLYSIGSDASTVGSEKKHKLFNGAKHASLKRVSFGSSKGSMVETLVYETPVQEEPESNHFHDHNSRLPTPINFGSPLLLPPDTDEGRERVRVSLLEPTPCPSTPGVLLLEPTLDLDEDLLLHHRTMATSPVELLTTHTEHTTPTYHTQISTDSGWDNPFRPDGDLSREADEIVELIKGGKPITPTPGQNAPPLPGVESTTPLTSAAVQLNAANGGGDLENGGSPLLNSTVANQQSSPRQILNHAGNNGNAANANSNVNSTPIKGSNANTGNNQHAVHEKVATSVNSATVEVGRVTAQGPGDASQVEHVTLKKKPKCKCCVLQ